MRKSKTGSLMALLVSFCLVGTGLLASALPAEAATAGVRFSLVQYNPPGTDTRNNRQINGEYLVVTNYAKTSQILTGWTIKDKANHVYVFGTFTVRPGKSVTIHTGRGTNAAAQRYWGMLWYVWNNTGDMATLRTRTGSIIDTCAWGHGSGKTRC
jgi:hypothetical protein